MKTIMFVLLCLVLLATAVYSAGENMLVNGDFETGDLHGWIDAGPDTVPRYATQGPFRAHRGFFPPATQVFSADAPMFIGETYDDANGKRHIRNIGLATDVKPRNGYSVGWTRTGEGKVNYPWVSQILTVAPGRYLMNASWDVRVRGGGTTRNMGSMAAIFAVHADDRVHQFTIGETKLRRTVWHDASKGEWINRTVTDHPIETSTGRIEVRLMSYHGNEDNIDPPDFEYVAFDNVYFSLTPDVLRERGK